MSKCKRCNIDILDDTMVCPLCRGVVQLPDNYEELEDFGMDEIDSYESKSRMYPDVTPVMKTIKLVIKCFIFFSI